MRGIVPLRKPTCGSSPRRAASGLLASGIPSPDAAAAVAALRSAIGGGSLHLRGQAGAVATSALSRRGRTARLTVIEAVLTSPDSEQIKEPSIKRQLDKRSPSFGRGCPKACRTFVLALRPHDLSHLGFHQLMHDPQPDTHAQREQSLTAASKHRQWPDDRCHQEQPRRLAVRRFCFWCEAAAPMRSAPRRADGCFRSQGRSGPTAGIADSRSSKRASAGCWLAPRRAREWATAEHVSRYLGLPDEMAGGVW